MTTSIIFTHPYLHNGWVGIALACFKIASLIPQNGFVPNGGASHAVVAITGLHQRASQSRAGHPD